MGRFTCFSAVRPELFVSSPLLGQVLRQVLLNPPWAAVLASVLHGLNHFFSNSQPRQWLNVQALPIAVQALPLDVHACDRLMI